MSPCLIASSEFHKCLMNRFADKVIKKLANYLKKTKGGVLPIPDIDYTRETMLGTQHVVTSEGTLSDVSTLYRVGDVEFKVDDNQLKLGISTSLRYAHIHFGKFNGYFTLYEAGDELDITVGDNHLDLYLTIDVGFRVSLDFALIKFSSFTLQRKKNGVPRSGLKDSSMNFFLHMYKDRLRKKIQNKIQLKIQQTLDKSVSNTDNPFLRLVLKFILREDRKKQKQGKT